MPILTTHERHVGIKRHHSEDDLDLVEQNDIDAKRDKLHELVAEGKPELAKAYSFKWGVPIDADSVKRHRKDEEGDESRLLHMLRSDFDSNFPAGYAHSLSLEKDTTAILRNASHVKHELEQQWGEKLPTTLVATRYHTVLDELKSAAQFQYVKGLAAPAAATSASTRHPTASHHTTPRSSHRSRPPSIHTAHVPSPMSPPSPSPASVHSMHSTHPRTPIVRPRVPSIVQAPRDLRAPTPVFYDENKDGEVDDVDFIPPPPPVPVSPPRTPRARRGVALPPPVRSSGRSVAGPALPFSAEDLRGVKLKKTPVHERVKALTPMEQAMKQLRSQITGKSQPGASKRSADREVSSGPVLKGSRREGSKLGKGIDFGGGVQSVPYEMLSGGEPEKKVSKSGRRGRSLAGY